MDSFLFSILWLSAGSFVVFFRRVKHHAFIHNMQLRVLRIKFMLYIYFYYYYFNLLFDLCPSLCGNSAPADLCFMYCYYQNFVCSHRKLINALKIFLRFELMDCDPVFFVCLANEANKKINTKYKDMLLGVDNPGTLSPTLFPTPKPIIRFFFFCFFLLIFAYPLLFFCHQALVLFCYFLITQLALLFHPWRWLVRLHLRFPWRI